MRFSSITLPAVLLAAGTGLAGVASAQTNPSAAQLIMSLKPTGMVSDTTRGIKPLDDSAPGAGQIINSLSPNSTVATTNRGIKPLAPSSPVAPTDRGLKPLPPSGMEMASSAAPAASAPAAAMPLSSSDVAAPNANLAVDFQTGSAELTPQARATLDQLGKALTSPELAAYTFKIAGHTDTVGDPSVNQSLSDQRAEAVKSYLEAKFGISDTRLQAVGLGESDLLVPTPPQTPEQRNRRVQIINLGQ
jgi:outer membrane protein OmpA-like peptidoglycan-associated protein